MYDFFVVLFETVCRYDPWLGWIGLKWLVSTNWQLDSVQIRSKRTQDSLTWQLVSCKDITNLRIYYELCNSQFRQFYFCFSRHGCANGHQKLKVYLYPYASNHYQQSNHNAEIIQSNQILQTMKELHCLKSSLLLKYLLGDLFNCKFLALLQLTKVILAAGDLATFAGSLISLPLASFLIFAFMYSSMIIISFLLQVRSCFMRLTSAARRALLSLFRSISASIFSIHCWNLASIYSSCFSRFSMCFCRWLICLLSEDWSQQFPWEVKSLFLWESERGLSVVWVEGDIFLSLFLLEWSEILLRTGLWTASMFQILIYCSQFTEHYQFRLYLQKYLLLPSEVDSPARSIAHDNY